MTRKSNSSAPRGSDKCKQKHFTQVFEVLQGLRKSGTFCDVHLSVRNMVIPVHGLLLSCCSSHFHKMLSENAHVASIKIPRVILLDNVDYTAVENVVDFLYMGQLSITVDNVNDILQFANGFEIAMVTDLCKKFQTRNKKSVSAVEQSDRSSVNRIKKIKKEPFDLNCSSDGSLQDPTDNNDDDVIIDDTVAEISSHQSRILKRATKVSNNVSVNQRITNDCQPETLVHGILSDILDDICGIPKLYLSLRKGMQCNSDKSKTNLTSERGKRTWNVVTRDIASRAKSRKAIRPRRHISKQVLDSVSYTDEDDTDDYDDFNSSKTQMSSLRKRLSSLDKRNMGPAKTRAQTKLLAARIRKEKASKIELRCDTDSVPKPRGRPKGSKNKAVLELQNTSGYLAIPIHKRIKNRWRPNPDKQVMCGLCDKKYSTQKQLTQHKYLDHCIPIEKGPCQILRCSKCAYKTLFDSQFRDHNLESHQCVKPFICDSCSKGFKTKKCLEIHQETHSGAKPYPCPQCGQFFTQLGGMQQHIKRIHEKELSFLCHLCPCKYFVKSELLQHLHKAHEIPIPTKYVRYSCDMCSFETFTKAKFENHIAVHSGNRAYQCEICGKKYTSKHSLREHMHFHGERKYVCEWEGCSYRAAKKCRLDEHIRIMHTHKHLKPYACHLCNYCCAIKGNLTLHLMKTHKLAMKRKAILTSHDVNDENGLPERPTRASRTVKLSQEVENMITSTLSQMASNSVVMDSVVESSNVVESVEDVAVAMAGAVAGLSNEEISSAMQVHQAQLHQQPIHQQQTVQYIHAHDPATVSPPDHSLIEHHTSSTPVPQTVDLLQGSLTNITPSNTPPVTLLPGQETGQSEQHYMFPTHQLLDHQTLTSHPVLDNQTPRSHQILDISQPSSRPNSAVSKPEAGPLTTVTTHSVRDSVNVIAGLQNTTHQQYNPSILQSQQEQIHIRPDGSTMHQLQPGLHCGFLSPHSNPYLTQFIATHPSLLNAAYSGTGALQIDLDRGQDLSVQTLEMRNSAAAAAAMAAAYSSPHTAAVHWQQQQYGS